MKIVLYLYYIGKIECMDVDKKKKQVQIFLRFLKDNNFYIEAETLFDNWKTQYPKYSSSIYHLPPYDTYEHLNLQNMLVFVDFRFFARYLNTINVEKDNSKYFEYFEKIQDLRIHWMRYYEKHSDGIED